MRRPDAGLPLERCTGGTANALDVLTEIFLERKLLEPSKLVKRLERFFS